MRDFFQKVREGYICIYIYIYIYVCISLYSLYLCSFCERKIALVYMYNIFDNYTIIQAIH